MSVANPQSATYLRIREISRKLQSEVVSRLDRKDVLDAAKRLGLMRRGKLTLDSENALPPLMDFCIYEFRRGATAVQRYAEQVSLPEGSLEAEVLRAMTQVRFSVFIAESLEAGTGFQAKDLLSGESMFIHDLGLSISGDVGMVMAAHLLSVGDMTCTTGAALPVRDIPEEAREDWIARFRSTTHGHIDVESAVRVCLKLGASTHIAYADADQTARSLAAPQEPSESTQESYSARRNDPCPCGSGKKYKACCLRR